MMRSRRGFSLAELMVTVAIIGVLAALGIPSWQQSQWRAKRAEAPGNVTGIRVAEMAYHAAWSTYISEGDYYPRDLNGSSEGGELVAWPAVGSAGNFDELGWRPFGEVRCGYVIPDGDTESLTIVANCDVDRDEELAVYTATHTTDGSWDADSVY